MDFAYPDFNADYLSNISFNFMENFSERLNSRPVNISSTDEMMSNMISNNSNRNFSNYMDNLNNIYDDFILFNLENSNNQNINQNSNMSYNIFGDYSINSSFFTNNNTNNNIDNELFQENIDEYYNTTGLDNKKREKLKEIIIKNECCELDKTCSICLENFNINNKCIKIPECQHIFHKDCIYKWFDKNKTCPICRIDIDKSIDRYNKLNNLKNREIINILKNNNIDYSDCLERCELIELVNKNNLLV